MKYIANKNLDLWFINCQRRESKNSIFTILLILFIGFAILADQRGDKIFGLSGWTLISLFFFYIFIRASFIFNRTIKEIEINELGVVFKTYGFKLFGLIPLTGKRVATGYRDLKFSLKEFPLKENKKALIIECYLIVIKDVEYYLLHKDFEDSLIQTLADKIQTK
ncbi:hypothetical protein OIU83_11690 [Flavobacterium sp. LS1R49]|uniref:Uncharacterized protein n=1 Tax=Flavobacterium shii TaxID=2987687 RepID=A0A9X2YV93_9FLAO|nr:hypothetical protein [Flavobacterium shii]MCV9928323.1 hypothetical protein [Flavobacterium shii]